VYITPEKLRCCLLDTAFGLTDEEALWTALSSWAIFQPRRAMPRQDPGSLFYTKAFFHAFERYWDYLACLDQHPDFKSEVKHTQYCMMFFSQGLSAMAAQGTFELRSSAEAKEDDVETVEHAAVSRLRPIQNGLDYCEEHGRSDVTVLGGPAPREARTMF
jgi:hypothetical protein